MFALLLLLFGKCLFTSFIHGMHCPIESVRLLHFQFRTTGDVIFFPFAASSFLAYSKSNEMHTHAHTHMYRERKKCCFECKSNSFIMHFCSFGAFFLSVFFFFFSGRFLSFPFCHCIAHFFLAIEAANSTIFELFLKANRTMVKWWYRNTMVTVFEPRHKNHQHLTYGHRYQSFHLHLNSN